jgi:methylthioxylose transferase
VAVSARVPRPTVLWVSLIAGVVLALYVIHGMATRTMVLGSPANNWEYPYIQPFEARFLVPFVLVSAICGALLAVPSALVIRYERLLIALWFAVALISQDQLRSMTPFSFHRIFISDGANSFFSVTARHDAATALTQFASLRPTWPLHAQSNLPGKLMLLYGLEHLSRRPKVLAWLVVAVSNLGGLCMYWFVRDLFKDRQIAFYSLVLYFFVPAKLFFFPLLNTVTPAIILLCAALLMRWLTTGSWLYPALLGIGLYGLVFFEPLPLVMGLLFAALTIRAWWMGQMTSRLLILQSAVIVLAFAATYAALRAGFGFDLVKEFRAVGADAMAFNTDSGRPYGFWVKQNLRDFLIGVGACQAVLVAGALADGLSGARSWSERLTRPAPLLCASLLAILLAIDLIGINRGEVIRLWIFLACFFQIPAAYVCARLQSRAAFALVLGTTILLAAIGAAMAGFIIP